jgi:hypothetical protein
MRGRERHAPAPTTTANRTATVAPPRLIGRWERVNSCPELVAALEEAEALSNPLEFSDAGWSIAVSYPGQVWSRVPCGRWC